MPLTGAVDGDKSSPVSFKHLRYYVPMAFDYTHDLHTLVASQRLIEDGVVSDRE